MIELPEEVISVIISFLPILDRYRVTRTATRFTRAWHGAHRCVRMVRELEPAFVSEQLRRTALLGLKDDCALPPTIDADLRRIAGRVYVQEGCVVRQRPTEHWVVFKRFLLHTVDVSPTEYDAIAVAIFLMNRWRHRFDDNQWRSHEMARHWSCAKDIATKALNDPRVAEELLLTREVRSVLDKRDNWSSSLQTVSSLSACLRNFSVGGDWAPSASSLCWVRSRADHQAWSILIRGLPPVDQDVHGV